ncbi:MAG: AI-2E family transporter [Candidatus Moranbacteria bacterium]|nr:AI-2E family transporter [Candidatus Moranbacteria bacterium]
MTRQFDLSMGTVWRIFFIIAVIGILYVLRSVIALFCIAFVISSACGPAVLWMHNRRVPRPLAVGVIYIVFASILGLLFSFVVPSVAEQVSSFSRTISGDASAVSPIVGVSPQEIRQIVQSFGEALSSSFGDILSKTVGVFQGLVGLMAVVSMSFYLSLDPDGLRRFLISITPKRYQDYVVSLATRIQQQIGKWMLGQLFVMVLVGVLYYIVLSLLGVPYALVLAIIGGLVEIIPYIGPVVAGVPAVLLAFFMVSPWTSVIVLVSYILIQQVENHVIIPQIMRRAVGLNPLVVILSLLVGAQLGGVLGILLAVPVATALNVFLRDVFDKKMP